MSAALSPGGMRLLNELTELTSRVKDLGGYTDALHTTMTPAEATLISAQAKAMQVYSEMLVARLYLLHGKKL